MIIQSIKPQSDGLNVYWNNCISSCFPWLWIRDHSENEIDLHPDSKQRQIDVFSVTPDNSISRVDIDQNKKNIIVKWSDNSESCISFELLQSMSIVGPPSAQALSDGSYWNSVIDIKIFPEMSYNEFMDDGGLNKWLGHIQANGFVLVTDTPA